MQHQPLLAALDLGSNSFRLQIARVENDQLYMLDGLRESVRLAAGITSDQSLDSAAQQRALDCLQRFGERLRGLPREAVRAVGTNALRVAKNSDVFLPQAEAALGFPIDIVAGREEARLIYLGVAHGLPPSDNNRLVVDIGGGSTEFIIGQGLRPIKLESLYMGCVSYSLRFFPHGKITKSNLKQAVLAARNELQTISGEFSSTYWRDVFGSSGTARALAEILVANNFSQEGITRDGMEQMRSYLLKVGDVSKLNLQGLRGDRIPVLPGGFAIMYAAFSELGIIQMQPVTGALREGVLYDLLGRFHDHDMREITVAQFMRRYHIDGAQAKRVEQLALQFVQQLLPHPVSADTLRILSQSARMHEIGLSVAHSGYHKHTAYILANADMPGFTQQEQNKLSLLVLAHRGRLEKMRGLLDHAEQLAQVIAIRLAVLFCRNRKDATLPDIALRLEGQQLHLQLADTWLAQNPLTEAALQAEIQQWKSLDIQMRPLPTSL